MTRFARAKGSKASNEKKPEEASSWAEMKNSMLSKKSNKVEEFKPKEKVKTNHAPRPTEWAPLGDDQNNSTSLLKPNFNKKSKLPDDLNGKIKTKLKRKKDSVDNCTIAAESEFSDLKPQKRKKKKKNLDTEKTKLENIDSTVKKIKKKKIVDTKGTELGNTDSTVKKKKKKKNVATVETELENTDSTVKKKKKKRSFTEVSGDSEVLQPTKKNKKLKTEEILPEANEKPEQKSKRKEIKERKKFRETKKKMKMKYFKSDFKGYSKSNQYNEKSNEQSKGKKKFKNKGYQEGKSGVEELIINGEKIPIVKFQGFFVTLEDAERLKKLRNEMIKEGIPKDKLEAAIKLERRRAEKALSRLKKSVCFHCRGHGHLLSNCPKLTENENTSTGICYKCGSTEHSASECKVVKGSNFQYAECFICKEQGHIARQCPDNPRGLYPQGGGCRECGDVTHLRKDCPKIVAQKTEEVLTVGLRNDRNLECLDEEIASREKHKLKNKVKKNPTVKF